MRNNKRATTREDPDFNSSFLIDRTCERPLLLPLAFSRALSVTSKIIIRKTYVKELLQINDVIILPHTHQKKKLETLTDKVT